MKEWEKSRVAVADKTSVLCVWIFCMRLLLNCLFIFIFLSARSDRYHHLASDEDEETNDEESSLEIRQFASWSHRFSKVKTALLEDDTSGWFKWSALGQKIGCQAVLLCYTLLWFTLLISLLISKTALYSTHSKHLVE